MSRNDMNWAAAIVILANARIQKNKNVWILGLPGLLQGSGVKAENDRGGKTL